MNKIAVKVVKEENVRLPKYMTKLSAGMDVCANITKDIILGSLERTMIPTGLKLEIPAGYEVQVRPRSGLAAKHGITLVNSPGTIDADYRGEIKLILINLSKEKYKITPNERIGQLVLQKVYQANLIEVVELQESERSEGGFGHTGK